MTDCNYEIKHSILLSLDNSFKKARILEEHKKIPYAVVIAQQTAKILNMDNFIYFSKNGYRSIPILKSTKLNKDIFQIAFTENELFEML